MAQTEETKARVLVVDDQQVMRLLARGALEEAGFSVVEAEDGERALDVTLKTKPDLVLLDVVMPKLDGFETCRRLRERPESRHTPVMMMTGCEDVGDVRRAFDVGATDFVVKPINWLILSHRLEYMLRASRASADLRNSRAMLANAQRIAGIGYWEWDLATGELCCSEELFDNFGFARTTQPSSFAAFMARVHVEDRAAVEHSVEEALEGRAPQPVEFRVGADGGRRLRQQIEAVTSDSGEPLLLTAIVQDVTEQRAAEETIQYLAYYDGLTGLPNRRAFSERLDLALAAARRSGRPVGVVFLDIDRFKRINDTLGHDLGDRVLQRTADRLVQSVRSTDCVSRPSASDRGQADLVCRFGGDEFVVLLADVAEAQGAAAVARRLIEAVSRQFEVDGQSIRLTASLGISIHPGDGEDADDLIRNAAAAVSHCKERGGNQYQFYSESMNATALEQLVLEAALSRAIERDQLELHFQPQFDIVSGAIVGAEALLRWNHPDRGLLLPGTFIPLAESSGLIVPIGAWVLEEACRQVVAWRDEGLSVDRVSVNISSRQVEQAGLVDSVRAALEETGLDAESLELELTESTLLHDETSTLETLAALRGLGVRLSMDDFGTGYSALSYLGRFPLGALKIDRSFVVGTPDHTGNAGICRAIVAMAESLGMRVIAEGVENESQLEFLRQQGCEEVQGFLLSRPIPAAEFGALMRRMGKLPAALRAV